MRNADILPLYNQARLERFLRALKSTDAATIHLIRKEAMTNVDREAIRLLWVNGILSIPIWAVDFEEERGRATVGEACVSSSPTIPTRSRCFT